MKSVSIGGNKKSAADMILKHVNLLEDNALIEVVEAAHFNTKPPAKAARLLTETKPGPALYRMALWPNGQGVALLKRRLQVRVLLGSHSTTFRRGIMYVTASSVPPLSSRPQEKRREREVPFPLFGLIQEHEEAPLLRWCSEFSRTEGQRSSTERDVDKRTVAIFAT
ncbi:unnamed protein product [Acanthocheilonema viteae]|uniref:Uncharacterized protein n=1 Tax=Acanthocheilonema viteae TaxID=6277 RepID=A0A498S6L1_ACAVI|nr:unnamed protein product [Acanthocheilonema viteae]